MLLSGLWPEELKTFYNFDHKKPFNLFYVIGSYSDFRSFSVWKLFREVRIHKFIKGLWRGVLENTTFKTFSKIWKDLESWKEVTLFSRRVESRCCCHVYKIKTHLFVNQKLNHCHGKMPRNIFEYSDKWQFHEYTINGIIFVGSGNSSPPGQLLILSSWANWQNAK